MKISIITPAYNCEKFIEKCILSVQEQDNRDIEHIIINDGSKDGTENIIKTYAAESSIKWVAQDNHGIAYTMNKGFEIAGGDIYAWLDADNYYQKGIINEIVDLFEHHPDIDIIYGNIEFVDLTGNHKGTHKPPTDISFKKALLHTTGAIPLQPAVFFRKRVYPQPGFNTGYRIAGDYEFWLKVLQKNPRLMYIDKTIGFYTLIQSGASQSFKGIRNGYKEVLTITKMYHQPLYGRIILLCKYIKGFLGNLARGYVNR